MTTTTEPLIYGNAHDHASDHALRVVLTERIVTLLAYRRWYRQNRWAEWSDLRIAHDTELRALLRVHRLAKRVTEGMPDPIDEYKGWLESELREAYGG